MLRTVIFGLLCTYLSSASAVQRDYFGEGQVLLFPFFTAENGWDTYLNVSTRYDRSIILKVRVLDGEDGVVVNTFNVYLDQFQNWRAAIAQNVDDQSILRIAEGACAIADSGVFGGAGTDFPLATATGMIEVYEVGTLRGDSEDLGCEELANQWLAGGVWATDPLEEVSSGYNISGHFNLVNVEQGLSAEHVATGLTDFSETMAHTSPFNTGSPSLAEADPTAILPSGEQVDLGPGQGIDAIALLLSTNEGYIANDVVTAVDIGASTDWVVSFPLRGYKSYGFFDLEIDGVTRSCNHYRRADGEAQTIQAGLNGPWMGWGGGAFAGGSPSDIAPEPQVQYSAFLCYSVNVLAFSDDSSVFLPSSSKLLTFVAPDLVPASPSSTVQYRFFDGIGSANRNDGRPVLAFRATTFLNGTLDGGSVLANYMILKPHRVR